MFQHYFFKCFSILYMFEYLVFFKLSPRRNFFATFYAITCSWYLITFLNRFWHIMHVMVLDVLSLFLKLKIVYFILTTTSSLGCLINFFLRKIAYDIYCNFVIMLQHNMCGEFLSQKALFFTCTTLSCSSHFSIHPH